MRDRPSVGVAGAIRYILDDETNENPMQQSDYNWPHAFATKDEILSRYGSNHIHAIPGDHVGEIRALCEILDVD